MCASDAIGSVILLGKNEKTILGDKERVLVRTAASFLGRRWSSKASLLCRCNVAVQGGGEHLAGKLWYSSRVRLVMVSQEASGFVT